MHELVSTQSMPRVIAQQLNELPFGSQTQVQVGDGRLAAFLAYAGHDAKLCTVKYALRVLNNTPYPARAHVCVVDDDGNRINAYPFDFEIAPFAMRDDLVPIRLDVTGPYNHALLEVASQDAYFTVEAPAPPPKRTHWMRWAAAALVPLMVLGATDLAAPRILGLSAPQRALAGTTVQVPFQVSGIGSVQYDVMTRDGLSLTAGLADRSGVLRIPIPAHGEGAPYTLHVRMRNAVASAQQSATIGVVAVPKPQAAPASPGALISELAVAPSPVQAGHAVDVTYAAHAAGGNVWLLDAAGRTWASAPLSPAGITRMTVPQAAAGREMRVVLHAQSGKQHAESSVGLTVLAQNAVAAVPTTAPQPAATAQSSAASAQVSLSSQVVSPGDSVTVRVSGVSGDVRIALMSSSGATMAQGDADAGDGGVTLTAPNVSAVTTYYVVATFSSGVSQQSVVRRLVVTPR